MKGLPDLWRCALVLACGALIACDESPGPERVPADVAIAWNARVLTMAEAEDKLLTLKGVRTAAMAHVAMHDALNSIHRRYAQYAYASDAAGADPVVAAAQAGYEVAVSQYPGEKTQLDAELETWLKPVTDGPAKARAVAIGKEAAVAILKNREDDGWNTEAGYQLQPMAPGVYAEFPDHSGTPQGFVFGAGWAAVKPFTLRTQDQFRSPPPPAITSDEYNAAYDEVREVGRFESKTRTADQSHLAMWWKDFVEKSHNRLARELLSAERTDLWDAARTLALLNMSISDAYVSSFESKFFYNHWRPFTAIRWAEHDGNPKTELEPQWDNTHRHTYPFPSYPSAHGTACAAAMTVLAATFGDSYRFTMSTPEVDAAGPMSAKIPMNPPTRSFDSFSVAAMECALSRLYLGIHFRYDSLAGNHQGKQVGSYAIENALAPTR